MSRANTGDSIFADKKDHDKFFHYLSKYVRVFDFRLHAFCLMPNHFHLLLESGKSSGLSNFMRRLLTAYTIYFNLRHKRHGHLFQGRFKSLIVEKSSYLLPLSRYIHLNPKQVSKTNRHETYEGSSLRFYLNGDEPDFLHTGEILAWFKGNREAYARFVREGLQTDTKMEIYQQRFIGGEKFRQRFLKRVALMAEPGSRANTASKKADAETRKREILIADSIIELVSKHFDCIPALVRKSRFAHGNMGMARTIAIGLLREFTSWSSTDISRYMGIRTSIHFYIHKISRTPALLSTFNKIAQTLSKFNS